MSHADEKDRPKMLDLFSGEGGCSEGYHQAGFDVFGVDIKPMKRYRFSMKVADALEVLDDHTFIAGFDAIHASPLCNLYSIMTNFLPDRSIYPDLIPITREKLIATGKPWVIENVPGAPMRPDYIMCGCLVGLPNLKRERWFETSWQGLHMRPPCYHPEPVFSVTGHDVPKWQREKYGSIGLDMRKQAMGIDWMTRDGLSQAIPPAYTKFIGEQLLAVLSGEPHALSIA